MRIEHTNGAPEFIALRVEEDEGRREFEAIGGGELPADSFLDIQADDVNRLADCGAAIQFLFEPVNGRLQLGAGNSVGGLEFEQDGRTSADEGLHLFGVVHQRGLDRMQDDPGDDQRGDDDPEGKEVVPFWLVGEQEKSRRHPQPDCHKKEGVFTDK